MWPADEGIVTVPRRPSGPKTAISDFDVTVARCSAPVAHGKRTSDTSEEAFEETFESGSSACHKMRMELTATTTANLSAAYKNAAQVLSLCGAPEARRGAAQPVEEERTT
mmetsp:Transcript_17963/g.20557  ORF Transcript_17963/g.20557 Transcript_17963/m.20557 type:complete len:110 (-) Transcript_17963:182-511(-)